MVGRIAGILLLFGLGCTGTAVRGDGLSDQFVRPPAAVRPWVWYRWSGHVEREGIRADLQALADQGFGGFVLGFSDARALAGSGVEGNMDFGGPEFFDCLFFTLAEAQRLGLKVSVMPMNGWATAGGDWIAPEDREHVLVWDEQAVKGPGRQSLKLAPPLAEGAFYHDIATIAFPVDSLPDQTAFRKAAPRIDADTVPAGSPEGNWNADPGFAIDRNPGSFLALEKPDGGKTPSITLTFNEPFEASALYLHPGPSFLHNLSRAKFKLQVSDDGQTFRDVHSFDFDPEKSKGRAGVVLGFPQAAQGRVWHLRLLDQNWPYNAWIAEIELLQKGEQPSTLPRIPFGDAHAGGVAKVSRMALDAVWQPADAATTQAAAEIDLGSSLQPDGTLQWDAPAGDWVVARIGYTESGETTSAPTAFGTKGPNWEANKYSAKAAEAFLSGFLDKLLDDSRAKPFLGSTLVGVQLDSWECSYHLWSDAVADAWKERMPYGLDRWMPALLGFAVDSPEETKRFLWDYRRLRADLVGDTFLRTIRDRVHAAGLKLELEMTMFDRFKAFEFGDMPVTEFSPKGDFGGAGRLQEGIQGGIALTASAAHVYGQPIVSSEAFLAHERTFQPDHLTPLLGGKDDGKRKFDRDPYALKSAGDKAFAQGVNRLGLHLFLHQPFPDRKPGITTGYGTNFGRNLVWWKFAHAWTGYLTRCQFLLQQGVPESDFLFCLGEDAYSTKSMGSLEDRTYRYALDSGFRFDFCTGDAVRNRLAVRDGRICLPTGQTYPLLVVGSTKSMTFPLMEKIAELVEQGATVLAPRIDSSPSLADRAAGRDPRLAKLSQSLWGGIDGTTVKSHAYGKGRILWGYAIPEALRELGVEPGMTFTANPADAKVEFAQRRTGSDDLFFLSSQNDAAITAECSFRIAGKVPEFWAPDTGAIHDVPNAREENGRTIVPIDFPPNGSVFVVFREKHSAQCLKTRNHETLARELSGPWQVRFTSPFGEHAEAKFETLQSWTKSDDRFVEYFSGTAVYALHFNVPDPVPARVLDLGEVWSMAQVTVNGQVFMPLWKPPYQVDITGALKAGDNELEIEVANTWVNRIIGDLNLPAADRKTWLTQNPYKKHSPLRPAGLLGPVRLLEQQ